MAHKEMVQRAKEKKTITRNEITTLLKEKDDEDAKFTNAKMVLYENYPRQPSENDIKWLKAVQGKGAKDELMKQWFSTDDQRNDDTEQ